MPKRTRYNRRCGEVLDAALGTTCQVPIDSHSYRCRHHSKTPEQIAYVKAKRLRATLLQYQQDDTKAARSKFADLAFEHGLLDARVATALNEWRATKAREGTDYVSEMLRPPKD